jgi:secreted PhoX family phosphatase
MLNKKWPKWVNPANICVIPVLGLLGTALVTTASSPINDPGNAYERYLQVQSPALYGFGKPVANSANTPSTTVPGNQAVSVAQGLNVQTVSSSVGEDADQIAFWPNDRNPQYSIICNEIDGTASGSPASVQRVNLSTGQVSDMVFGMESCDPVRRTAWGTILVGEEAGPTGRVWEIIDPLFVNNVMVDRSTGTSSDPSHVAARTALGQLSYEGIAVLPDGTLYYGDELRPANGQPGGGIYKFVPAVKWSSGTAPITDLSQSPLTAGSVYVLRLGLRDGGTDYGQGNNTGAGKWIGPLPTDTSLATSALNAGGYTGYYRPEDMDLDPIALANNKVRFCWANTGNDTQNQWGEVLCLNDEATGDSTFTTKAKPIVEPFIIGNPSLRMPDNVAFQPGTGILYVNMDATTSAEDPTFTNDDVWACLPDGDDTDTLTDGCVRVMTLKDGEAEFTGQKFYADGTKFLIHLQHRTQTGRAIPNTTDQIMVSGLIPLPQK